MESQAAVTLRAAAAGREEFFRGEINDDMDGWGVYEYSQERSSRGTKKKRKRKEINDDRACVGDTVVAFVLFPFIERAHI